MPPHNLEPGDPYHRSYEDMWSSEEVEETWIEVGVDGKIARWRAKLFNKEGILLQDLMFDGVTEVGYFVSEGRAYRSPTKAEVFRDEQVMLLNFVTLHQQEEDGGKDRE